MAAHSRQSHSRQHDHLYGNLFHFVRPHRWGMIPRSVPAASRRDAEDLPEGGREISRWQGLARRAARRHRKAVPTRGILGVFHPRPGGGARKNHPRTGTKQIRPFQRTIRAIMPSIHLHCFVHAVTRNRQPFRGESSARRLRGTGGGNRGKPTMISTCPVPAAGPPGPALAPANLPWLLRSLPDAPPARCTPVHGRFYRFTHSPIHPFTHSPLHRADGDVRAPADG